LSLAENATAHDGRVTRSRFMPLTILSTRQWGSTKKEETHMRAIVYRNYGSPDVLELKEVAKPVPKDNEVLVKVHAASVNAWDWRFLRAKPFLVRLSGAGLLKPKHKILGRDITGRVEAVGNNVTQFQPGDEVFGLIPPGGFAEYASVPESTLALKPANTLQSHF